MNDKCRIEKLLAEGLGSEAAIKELIELIPELQTMIGLKQNHPAHFLDVFAHSLAVVRMLRGNDKILMMTALLHDIGKLETRFVGEDGFHHFASHEEVGAIEALKILKRIEYPRKESEIIAKLIKLHDTPIEDSETAIMESIEKHGFEFVKLLLIHQKADLSCHAEWYSAKKMPEIEKVEIIFNRLYKEKKELKV